MFRRPQRFLWIACFLLGLVLSSAALQSVARPETFEDFLKRTYTSIPGVAVSVIKDGKIVFEGGFGYSDAEKKTFIDSHTRFDLASVSKQITAMAVMMQKEAGRFQYDTPITEFFPEFRAFAKGVTVRNLLQHSAGFPDYMELCRGPAPARNGDIVALMAKKGKLDFEPGTKYAYSNTGYGLLAVLVERAASLSYPDFVEQKIFAPLGMKETFVNRWRIPVLPNVARAYTNSPRPVETTDVLTCNTIYGDGSVFSTAHDMALWNLYLEKNAIVGTTATMDDAYQPATLTDGATSLYGFGWQLRDLSGMKQYSHSGSWAGYHTFNSRLPDQRFAVVVLTNGLGAQINTIINRAIEAYVPR
jgi:CubicO group peptidase (beta-lactamase class C family)